MYRYFKRSTSFYRHSDTGDDYWNHMLNEWQKSSRYTPEEYLNDGYSELTESQAREILGPLAFAQPPKPAGGPKHPPFKFLPDEIKELCTTPFERGLATKTFHLGVDEGYRQAMEQKPAIPAPSPGDYDSERKERWIRKLATDIQYRFGGNTAAVREFLNGRIEEHGPPVQNVSPEAQRPPQAEKPPEKNIDWEQRRWDAAVAAMTGLLANAGDFSLSAVSDGAKEYADAVVAAMKGERK